MSTLCDKIESVNARMESLLMETRRALAGEREFGVEQVRALSALIEGMAPVMVRAGDFRRSEPEIDNELDRYKAQLGELQSALERVRTMLVAKRGQVEAGRTQLDALKNWTNALQHTR